MNNYVVTYNDSLLDLLYNHINDTYCFKVSQLLGILDISRVREYMDVPNDITYLGEHAVYELVSKVNTPEAYTFFRWFLEEIKTKQRHFKYSIYVVFEDLHLSLVYAKSKEEQIEIESAKLYLLKIEDIAQEDIPRALETLDKQIPERINQLHIEMNTLLKKAICKV